MTDYTQVKVGEIRQELVNKGMSEDDANAIKGKANLIKALEGLKAEEGVLDGEDIDEVLSEIGDSDVDELSALLGDGFEEDEEEEEEDSVESMLESIHEEVTQAVEATQDDYTSPEKTATDKVLSMLTDEELANGKYPRAVGLRRIAQMLLGEIAWSGPTHVQISHDQNGMPMACVVYEIRFKSGLTVADVSDCSGNNTPYTYAVHPSATASTKAQGRALKQALGIDVLTAEEMENDKDAEEVFSTHTERTRSIMDELDDTDEPSQISVAQAAAITAKCNTLGIDVDKFINKKYHLGQTEEKTYEKLEDVPYSIAQAMVKELNKYQGDHEDSKDIPEEIRV